MESNKTLLTESSIDRSLSTLSEYQPSSDGGVGEQYWGRVVATAAPE